MAENTRIDEFYEFSKGIHQSWIEAKEEKNDSRIQALSPLKKHLNVTLRPYQEAAVHWMINCERTSIRDETENSFDGLDVKYPQGGILADEMGLGKTVEVLALILCNPLEKIPTSSEESSVEVSSSADHKPTPKKQPKHQSSTSGKKRKSTETHDEHAEDDVPKKKKSGIKSDKYATLRAWYEGNLKSSVITERSGPQDTSRLKCFCDETPRNDETVTCTGCQTEQHAECVGNPEESEEYSCPWCLATSPPIKSGTTLIVSPPTISSQWIDEISKHVKSSSLKVLVYEGVKSRHYTQPKELASYDIVVTTYSVLCNELSYVLSEQVETRRLRHAKKYRTPVSPLTCVQWWRLCLDEAQMVEGSTTRTAMMACHMHSIHKWAVTGTPIQKTINDLYGLIKFLDVQPFADTKCWDRLMEDQDNCCKYLSPILWRSIKKDVFDQIGVPPQTSIQKWLRFSPVEGYFYQRIHNECKDQFKQKVNRILNPEKVRMKDLDRAQLSKLLLPLLRLRQACIHPQVVRSKYMRFKHTMTMEELMTDMVAKAKVDFTGALRAVVSSYNGIAGLRWIDADYALAVDCYRRILQIGNEYEHVAKIDTLQMIHTLHNLAELLERHGAGIPPTLRDEKLKEEVQALEQNYLKKNDELVALAQVQSKKMTEMVEEIADGRTVGYSTWWEDLLSTTTDEEDLMTRIKACLEDNKRPGHRLTTPTLKLNSLPGTLRHLGIWLADVDVARVDSLSSLDSLYKIPKEILSNDAVDCHLSKKKAVVNKRKKKSVKKCQLCTSGEVLRKYETLIFSITEQTSDKRKRARSDSEDEAPGVQEKSTKKLIEDLKNVEIYETKKEGNWKPSQHEMVLRVIASYVKLKRLDDWAKDATNHILMLGAIKKEFKALRAEWQKMSNLVSAKDEITMAKLRFRLHVPENEFEEATTSEDTDKTECNVVRRGEVGIVTVLLTNELENGLLELKRTSGILLYLKNLQKNGNVENEPCPVCQDKLEQKWSVLSCGHCLCFDCIPTLLHMTNSVYVECPMCRLKTQKQEVSYVVSNKSSEEEDDSGVRIVGSYSTKVEAVTIKLLQLRAKEPEVKVIIFSAWEKVLDILSEALKNNSVSFRRLSSLHKHKEGLKQFKNGPVTALLIPLSRGSKGLNITEATHVFLVEPILNPADELQALGRVHRIGQTKPTFVHRFIIHNTVEEKMAQSVDPDGWADGNATVSELFNLFRIDSEPQPAQI